MRAVTVFSAALAIAATSGATGGIAPAWAGGESIFKFNELVGIPRPYTGTANPIRGVNGGGLPWVIDKGKVKLDGDFVLSVEVRGLVFDPDDQGVIDAGLGGMNTIPAFKAIVSCQTVVDEGGGPTATVVNVETGTYPATTGFGAGDAKFQEMVDLPDPCIAPIVFVTSPGGAWFAATGF